VELEAAEAEAEAVLVEADSLVVLAKTVKHQAQ
jgi:hypothetical protein